MTHVSHYANNNIQFTYSLEQEMTLTIIDQDIDKKTNKEISSCLKTLKQYISDRPIQIYMKKIKYIKVRDFTGFWMETKEFPLKEITLPVKKKDDTLCTRFVKLAIKKLNKNQQTHLKFIEMDYLSLKVENNDKGLTKKINNSGLDLVPSFPSARKIEIGSFTDETPQSTSLSRLVFPALPPLNSSSYSENPIFIQSSVSSEHGGEFAASSEILSPVTAQISRPFMSKKQPKKSRESRDDASPLPVPKRVKKPKISPDSKRDPINMPRSCEDESSSQISSIPAKRKNQSRNMMSWQSRAASQDTLPKLSARKNSFGFLKPKEQFTSSSEDSTVSSTTSS